MKRVISVGVALLSLGAGLMLARVGWLWFHPESISMTRSARPFRVARAVYPFSVIPGGVYDPQELSESIQRDPVARRHYQGINPVRMWNSRLRAPMLAYVSFRRSGSIYWTSNKVTIPKGEMVLTDGVNIVRARCGNRIETKNPVAAQEMPLRLPHPMIPEPLAETSAEAPPEFVFETPIPELTPPSVMGSPSSEVLISTPAVQPGSWNTPLFCCSEVQPKDTPPTPVPEPGTMLLVSSGAAAVIAAVRRRSRV